MVRKGHNDAGQPAQIGVSGTETVKTDYSLAVEPTSQTDESLVRMAQAGDESAFEILISRYESKITSHIYAMLRDYDRALDLAQETFVRLLTRVDAYKEAAKFSTWLYRIGTNLAIDEIRRRRRWRLVPFISPTTGEAPPVDSIRLPTIVAPPTPDVPLLEDERRGFVRRAISALPSHYRSAILLKDMEDLPYDEVAEILDVPIGTVKSRVNRARALLKDSLQPVFDPVGSEQEPGGATKESSL